MICYAFPLAHEAKDVLKHCTEKEQFSIGNLHCTMGNFGNRPVLVALVGMGETLAMENTRVIFANFRPKAVVLAGYGGALVPQMKLGQVVIAVNFTSEAVLNFLRLLSGFDFATICTADGVIATPEERDQYARASQSQVVDMETAGVAEVVREREIPFLAVRVISDDYAQILPSGALAASFNAPKGRATPLRLMSYLATHPGEFAPFKKFVKGLSPARKNLTTFLQQLNADLPSHW